MTARLDTEAVVAAAELAHRAGGREFEVGYLHDDVPAEQAGWYAHVKLRGGRLTAEDHVGPSEAADALAERILAGGQCQNCGGFTVTTDAPAYRVPAEATLADGSTRTAADVAEAGFCRWRRHGDRWRRDCDGGPHQPAGQKPAGPNRAARRRQRRRGR